MPFTHSNINFKVDRGDPQTLGVSIVDAQINLDTNLVSVQVSVLAPAAEQVFLSIFNDLDIETHRIVLPYQTDGIHHALIHQIPLHKSVALSDQYVLKYGFRASGPYAPDQSQFFDVQKLLVDPYATLLDRPFVYNDALSCQVRGVNTATLVPKSIKLISDVQHSQARHTSHDCAAVFAIKQPEFIYEANVKALTINHPDVPAHLRGTIAALKEPAIIQHLQHIGVDTLELMPITAWLNERHLHRLGLQNAWGYNPVAMMALDPKLCPGGMAELSSTLLALQQANIQVILDVVFNHTAESDLEGPTISMRGLDHTYYYAHNAQGHLINDTGCGNSLACYRQGVVQLIMDTMRHWVKLGIAGFRFDLATVMGRLADGFNPEAPLLSAIAQDPVLKHIILIAEPWDIGLGGYQLGQFKAPWLEWNDKYRDDVRRFWHGTGQRSSFATRLVGSDDLFAQNMRSPKSSVNFIAAHDGFCLMDLVSYNQKHNLANGEHNRDGTDNNASWNHGVEGNPADAGNYAVSHTVSNAVSHTVIQRKRINDVKALLATLFLSKGTVMLTAGDELGRSQQGNNNAYAQDNEISWVDWSLASTELIECVAELTKLRKKHPFFSDHQFASTQTVQWIGVLGNTLKDFDWENKAACLGMMLLEPDEKNSPDAMGAKSAKAAIDAIDARDTIGTPTAQTNSPHASAPNLLIYFNAQHQTQTITLPVVKIKGQHWQMVWASQATATSESSENNSSQMVQLPERSVLVFESVVESTK